MVEWHHQLNGQALGAGDGQGRLACCGLWGCKESDTTKQLKWLKDFPDGLMVKVLLWWLCGKEFACKTEEASSIPGSGKSPRRGNGNPLQYSCLGNLMNRGGWQAAVYGFTKELDTTKQQKPPAVRLRASSARGMVLTPVQGTKIPHAVWRGSK